MPYYHNIPDIETLRHLPLTPLEKQLKRCAQLYGKEPQHVFTAREMSDYMTWMVKTFGAVASTWLLPEDIPSLLVGTDIAEIGINLLRNPNDQAALKALTSQYEVQTESHFFPKNQNISASRMFRYVPPYWHINSYFEVYYAFSGRTPMMFESETIILESGTVLIVPPKTIQACTCPADDCVAFCFMIRASTFSQVFLEQLSSQNLMSLFFLQALSGKGSTPYLYFDTGADSAIESLVHYIHSEFLSDNPYRSQMLNSLMSTFFLLLLQRYENTAQVSKKSSFHWKPEFISLFNDIQTNYASITLDQLSRKYNYSQRQLIRIIQNCTGKTFSQLLIQLKMEKAAQMLTAKPTPSIPDIAAEVGYPTLSSFYRTFLQYYGCTPGDYIQSYCSNQN